jgi:16S rRNA (guanine966-N2)-methyltransferase
MRIVGGRWAGRDLVSPGGRVRPTAEPVRDTWMEALLPDLPGARLLELFAGTGALGLEALSRGAASVDFVENGPGALHALKANVANFRVQSHSRIFRIDALAFLERVQEGSYDVCLADPPWTSRLADRVVRAWLARPFSRVLAVETSGEHTLPGRGKRHTVDDAAITVFRASPSG